MKVRLLGRKPDQWRPQLYLLFFLPGLQGVKPLEAPVNLHLTVLKTGYKTDQKHVDGYAFSCALKYEVTGKFERSTVLNSQVSYQNKMCMFYISSWIIFHIKSKQRVTNQCQDQPSTLQHLSNFSENILFFTISWPQPYLGYPLLQPFTDPKNLESIRNFWEG